MSVSLNIAMPQAKRWTDSNSRHSSSSLPLFNSDSGFQTKKNLHYSHSAYWTLPQASTISFTCTHLSWRSDLIFQDINSTDSSLLSTPESLLFHSSASISSTLTKILKVRYVPWSIFRPSSEDIKADVKHSDFWTTQISAKWLPSSTPSRPVC